MNKEIIRELADHADRMLVGEGDISMSAFEEKFAELIVRECIGVVNKRFMGDLNREDMEVRRCVDDLKKHFEVE